MPFISEKNPLHRKKWLEMYFCSVVLKKDQLEYSRTATAALSFGAGLNIDGDARETLLPHLTPAVSRSTELAIPLQRRLKMMR